MLFFEFPEDARWNDDRDAVEFSAILRPYEGTVRITRRVFQGLLDQHPTPERCIEAFHLQRTHRPRACSDHPAASHYTDPQLLGSRCRQSTGLVSDDDKVSLIGRGTGISNPSSSSAESANYRFRCVGMRLGT